MIAEAERYLDRCKPSMEARAGRESGPACPLRTNNTRSCWLVIFQGIIHASRRNTYTTGQSAEKMRRNARATMATAGRLKRSEGVQCLSVGKAPDFRRESCFAHFRARHYRTHRLLHLPWIDPVAAPAYARSSTDHVDVCVTCTVLVLRR